ncbi:MAG: response regulator transcription factor [Bacteroidia bacterium]|nr:response regulator transcription factor [Bacteroidia bacterium]
MNRHRLHIAIMVHSPIIYEGLHAVISQSEMDCIICKPNSLDDLENVLHSQKVDILITNPLLLVNREKEVKRIRKNYPDFSIVGVNLGIVDNHSLSLLDSSFTIFDTAEQVLSKLQKAGNNSEPKVTANDDNLTERELDVLTKLVHGFSNKEIADSLNISIHTVVTHRKNITAKTGIRSQSGLTIYAITKRIISIEDVDLQNH